MQAVLSKSDVVGSVSGFASAFQDSFFCLVDTRINRILEDKRQKSREARLNRVNDDDDVINDDDDVIMNALMGGPSDGSALDRAFRRHDD